MSLDFLFFRLAPAIQFIFKINYIPQELDFKELTSEQYNSFYKKATKEDLANFINKKIFIFLPEDTNAYNRIIDLFGDNLMIVGVDEILAFKAASDYISERCSESGNSFENLSDKLSYLAQILPDAFTQGTPYSIHKTRLRYNF